MAFSQHRVFYDEDLFVEIDYGEIPNYDNIKDSWQEAPFLQGHDYGAFYYNNSQEIVYNTKHAEPTSWEDAKDPDHEGELTLHNNTIARFANMCTQLDLDPDKAANHDALFDEMEELHQNVFTYWVG